MSGHSKWHNIQAKKGKADAARGKIFTKLGRELLIAVKAGGPDPAGNSKLKDVIAKCKAANMPNDTINNAIKKAAGATDSANYEEMIYEGYGTNGVAVIVEASTDNKNRTAADVRSTLTKLGGTLGSTGCVSYMFQTKGIITYSEEKYTEDQILEAALDNGAEDVSTSDGVIEVTTAPADFATVLEAMQAAGFEQESADIQKIADQTVTLDNEKANKVLKIVERLEDLEDVQLVSTNLELPDDFEAEA